MEAKAREGSGRVGGWREGRGGEYNNNTSADSMVCPGGVAAERSTTVRNMEARHEEEQGSTRLPLV